MKTDLGLASVEKIKVMRSFRLGILLVAALTTPALAETVSIDDFNDGNDDGWSHLDLLPATYGPAIFDPSSFEYRLASTGPNPDPSKFSGTLVGAAWNASADPFYSNGLLRSKIRIDEIGAGGGLAMRVTGEPPSIDLYEFAAFYVDAEINGFFFGKSEAGIYTESEVINLGSFDLRDWILEAGAIGDRLTLKYWLVGGTEPTEPQWEWIDPNPLGAGMFGVTAGNDPKAPDGVRIGATFDDIFFTSVGTPNDCNADGAVDIEDTLCATAETISDILAAANLIQGDADGNGKVEFADFLTLSTNYGQDGNYQQGNFDLIAGVEFADFLILADNFGQAASVAAAVPEPTGWVLVLFGVLFLALTRRGFHGWSTTAHARRRVRQ